MEMIGGTGCDTLRRYPPAMETRLVRAAGGLVVDGNRVLLVHRPKYDDWTFPKGKAERNETDEVCALREVREETGLDCELVSAAGTTEYVDTKGRPKVVRWFLMRPVDGTFEPTEEVDELRWLEPAEAHTLLSYGRDVKLLRALE